MRVVSFNIRNGRAFDGWRSWPFRRRRVAALLRSFDADLIGIQEAYGFQQRYLDRQLREHSAYARPRNRLLGERIPVYVRTDRLEVVDRWTRWFSDAPLTAGSRLPEATFPRIATAVELTDRASGVRFGFVNVHLDEKHAGNRLASIEMLLEWLGEATPWIVAGDFNATPDDAEIALLTDAGFDQALPPGAGGTSHDFSGRIDGPRIDHVLHRGPLQVRASEVFCEPHYADTSDHWPIVVDFEVVS